MLKQLISNEEKQRRIRDKINQRKGIDYQNFNELASLLDYRYNTLYVIMSGKSDAPDILIYKFCEYFKLKPGWFFGREKDLSTYDAAIDAIDIKEELLKLQEINKNMTSAIKAVMSKTST